MSRWMVSAALTTMALTTAGCGPSGPPIPTEKFVYTSMSDCADGGRLSAEDCSRAIDKAVVAHEQQAPKYITLKDCEAVENMDRCERVAERHYRPRIMAYLYIVNKTITAMPLYSGAKGANVFRDFAGTTFDYERTEGVKFSKQAVIKAEGFTLMKHQKLRG